MKQYKLICPNCGTVYNSGSRAEQTCLKCGVGVVYSGFTSDDYDKKTADEKRIVINGVMNGKIVGNSVDVKKDRFWISIIDNLVNAIIVIGIVGSLAGGITLFEFDDFAFLGVIVIVGGIFMTLLSAAKVKIFLGVADDIRYLRNHLSGKK